MSDDEPRPLSEAVTLAVSSTSTSPPHEEHDITTAPKHDDAEKTPSIHSSSPSTAADITTAVSSPRKEYSQSQVDLSTNIAPLQAATGTEAGLPDKDAHHATADLAAGLKSTQLAEETTSISKSDLDDDVEEDEKKQNIARKKSSVNFSAPIARPTPAGGDPEKGGVEGTIHEEDPDIVGWDGPDDPENPKNWTFKKKWAITSVVSLFTLMSPISSSMLAPALPAISIELGMVPGSVLSSMTLSIFVLAYAVGPLFLGPLSELMGRQIILQCSNIFFLVFNIACSQAKTPAQILVFRFLAGLGGSAPLAVGGGSLSDMFIPEERGVATAIYSMMPLTGPALGPIAGGWIAERTSWRWVFYSSSAVDGLVQLFGFLYLKETYAPKILADKAKRLRKETGNPNLRTVYDRPDRTYASVVRNGLLRPLTFLATEPIVQVFAAYQAALYGLMYLTLTTFSELWSTKYHESVGIGSLHYLALGIGFYLGAVLGAKTLDKTYRKLKEKNGGVGTPEMRMPLMIITSFLVPIGLLIYGWTADKAVFWIAPDIGAMIFCVGVIGAFLAISTYIIDNFHIHSASALAAAAAFRSLAGFGFPLFADAMFQKLGIGWGNSLCALISILFLPAPWFFYYYGPTLRAKSRFAKQQTKEAARISMALRQG